jgi:hypothetical protein
MMAGGCCDALSAGIGNDQQLERPVEGKLVVDPGLIPAGGHFQEADIVEVFSQCLPLVVGRHVSRDVQDFGRGVNRSHDRGQVVCGILPLHASGAKSADLGHVDNRRPLVAVAVAPRC